VRRASARPVVPLHVAPEIRVRMAAQQARFKSPAAKAAIPLLIVSTLVAGFFFGPMAMFFPLMIGVLGWGAFVLPLEVIIPVVAFVMLSVNNPSGQPGNKKIEFVLNPIGDFFYANLPTKFALADVIVAFIVFRAAAILLLSERGVGKDRRPPRPFAQACLVAVLAIVAMEFWGVFINDGNFQQSLWQLRVPLLVPCFALAVSAAASDVGIRRIRVALLAAGLVKAFECLYLAFVRHIETGESGSYITTHSDTLLWCTCLFILLATWFETRTPRDRNLLLFISPILLLAIVENNRRVAYVALIAGLMFIVSVAHRPVKRQLGRYLVLTWPLLLAYVVVGFASNSQSKIFYPINKIASVSTKSDASTSTRDIENFNLLWTVRVKPLTGQGFGHEYTELVVAYDIHEAFSQYRFLPHNSFLAFWAFNGLFGSSMYFLLPVVAIFYAVSCRRRSAVPLRRAASAWSVCTIIAFMIQAWADLGMQDWVGLFCVGIAYGVSGSLGRALIEEGEAPRTAPAYDYVEEEPDNPLLVQVVEPALSR
jgi:O-Antigen ligase